MKSNIQIDEFVNNVIQHVRNRLVIELTRYHIKQAS